MADTLQYIIDVRGGTQGAAEVRKVEGAIAGASGKTQALGKHSKEAEKHTGKLTSSMKKLAGGLALAGAGYAAWNAAKNAIAYSKDLSLQTQTLSRTTGMSVQESSRWVATANAMGVQSNALGMTFTRLSAAALKQANSNGKSTTAFSKLGISQDYVKKHMHDMPGLMGTVTDKLNSMHGGVEKNALMMELFGRGWKALNPVLSAGSKGMNDMLGLARKYGVELTPETQKQMAATRRATLEWKFAVDGLRLAFTKLVTSPIMLKLLSHLTGMVKALREGNWKSFGREAQQFGVILSRLVEQALPRAAEAFGRMGIQLLKAFLRGFASANLGGQLSIIAFLAVKFGLVTKVVTLFWAAMRFGIATVGGPYTLLIAALIAGAIYVATHWKEVKKVLGKVWDWMKHAGEDVAHALSSAWRDSANFIIGLLNTVIDGINLAIKAYNFLPFHKDIGLIAHIGLVGQKPAQLQGTPPNLPVPKGAHGASVLGSGLMEVGELGPEVVAMPRGASVAPLAHGAWGGGDIVLQLDSATFMRWTRRQEGQAQAAAYGA